MPGSFYGEFLSTAGCEIEGSIYRDAVVQKVISPVNKMFGRDFPAVSIGRDASTEFNAFRTNTSSRNIAISYHTPAGRKLYNSSGGADLRVYGYELITNPLPITTLEPVIFHTTQKLVEVGDYCSDRTAVHWHVGFVNNFRLLKNFLRIALMVDPVLFRIGGMGRKNRGWINHYAYCRPLLHSSAVYVGERTMEEVLNKNRKKKFAKIMNPLAALDADNLVQFWASLGVNYRPGGGAEKYWPSRYSGINLYSIPQHGTVEFRHFNKTLDPLEIMSVGKFVRAITELATLIGKHESVNFEVVPSDVEISESDGSDILYRLYGMCQNYDVEDMPTDLEMTCLLDLLKNSHMDPIPEKPVLTHLKENHTISNTLAEAGNLEFVPEVLPSHFVDIHNIGEISLFNGSQNSPVPTLDNDLLEPSEESEWDNEEETWDDEHEHSEEYSEDD